MKKRLFMMTLPFLLLGTAGVNAQVRIGANTAPNEAAILDLNANDTKNDGTKALALPRVNLGALTESNAKLEGITPLNGMLVYNTNSSLGVGLYYWVTDKWIKLKVEDESGNPINTSLKVEEDITRDYTAKATDDILLFKIPAEAELKLTLPTNGVDVGHKLYFSEAGGSGIGIVIHPTEAMYNGTYNFIYPGSSGTLMYIGKGKWTVISGSY
jgi:hypothetical protein